jgi:hypothetical protein
VRLVSLGMSFSGKLRVSAGKQTGGYHVGQERARDSA